MTPSNNFNILPFYTDIGDQNHLKEYAYGEVYNLISLGYKFLPFQIVRPHTAASMLSATLHSLADGSSTDILAQMLLAGLHIKHFDTEGYDLIINPSIALIPGFPLPLGNYYLEMSDGISTWYSDVFNIVEDVSEFIKLSYYNNSSDNITYAGGHIDYSGGFKNYLFIQGEISKPEYPFTEVSKTRNGKLFIEKQISEKKYKFAFIAPEYLCDALRVVRMHDFISIEFRGKTYTIENIIFDPKWEAQGDLAVVTVEFECDNTVLRIGKGFIIPTEVTGDFSDDFSDDFSGD